MRRGVGCRDPRREDATPRACWAGEQCDVYLRDRVVGTTELVSVAFAGEGAGNASCPSGISADGRYVAFCLYGDADATPTLLVDVAFRRAACARASRAGRRRAI